MNRRDMNKESTDFTDQNSIIAYKLGTRAAEVRVLKWAAAIAIIAHFALYGYLAQQVSSLQAGQIKILERLASMEQRVASNEQKINTHSHL